MTDVVRTTQRYLVCDASGDADEAHRHGLWTRSPLSCLERAIETVPDVILIRFPEPSDPTLEMYLELCELLKHGRRTQGCGITALMPGKDRCLMDKLHLAGVDYAVTAFGGGLDDGKVLTLLGSLDESHRVDHCRLALCPYLHNVTVDAFRSMSICGAYLDRMALGGRRLHELCETENHAGCDYFQAPRVRS